MRKTIFTYLLIAGWGSGALLGQMANPTTNSNTTREDSTSQVLPEYLDSGSNLHAVQESTQTTTPTVTGPDGVLVPTSDSNGANAVFFNNATIPTGVSTNAATNIGVNNTGTTNSTPLSVGPANTVPVSTGQTQFVKIKTNQNSSKLEEPTPNHPARISPNHTTDTAPENLDSFEQLSYSFTSAILSPSQLKNFSTQAEKKLKDLEGYLGYISHPDYDQAFKKQAEEMT